MDKKRRPDLFQHCLDCHEWNKATAETKEEDLLQLEMQIHETVGVWWERKARIVKSRHNGPLENTWTQFSLGSTKQGDAGIEAFVNNGFKWDCLMEISFYNL